MYYLLLYDILSKISHRLLDGDVDAKVRILSGSLQISGRLFSRRPSNFSIVRRSLSKAGAKVDGSSLSSKFIRDFFSSISHRMAGNRAQSYAVQHVTRYVKLCCALRRPQANIPAALSITRRGRGDSSSRAPIYFNHHWRFYNHQWRSYKLHWRFYNHHW